MPLKGFRAIEIGALPAAAYCSRLLADFGAETIKIEPAGGDPERRGHPRIDIGEGQRESGFFAYLNYNKKSVILPDPEAGKAARLRELIGTADVLIDSLNDEERNALGIDHAELRRTCPGIVIADISWFGRSGPYRDFKGADAVCRALAGLVKMVGPVEGPPLSLPDFQACISGGLSSFIPILGALLARLNGGPGRNFEISVHDANVTLAEFQAIVEMPEEFQRRWGINRFARPYPLGIFPCKSGWLGVTVVTPAQWQSFCNLLNLPELGKDPDYVVPTDRLMKADELEARFLPQLLEKTAEEWFDLARKARLPFAIVPDMSQVLSWEVFRQRKAIVPIRMGEKTVEAPGSPLHLTKTPPKFGGEVPRPGEHTDEILDPKDRRRPAADMPRPSTENSLPLKGMRIVDLSMGWAGPLATRNLADMGADVIKIEACKHPDWWRGVDNRPIVFEQMLYEKSNHFNMMNRNKRAITLDLARPEGVRLAKELIKDADGVIANYSAEVLPKLGLDYPQLLEINPSIVMVTMPAYGSRGPWRDCRAYGSTLEHGSGLPRVSGYEGGPPAMNHLAYGDPVGGLSAASAMLTALVHRKRTGVGQLVDLSQVQCLLPFAAVWAIEQSAFGRIGPRRGNRHPQLSPQGVFRCAGEDEWILVSVTDEAAWRSLCTTIGRKDLLQDPGLENPAGRRLRETEIEAAIEAWTRRYSPDTAMGMLQEGGIAAGAVRSPTALLSDPHLGAREFWQEIARPFVGKHKVPSAAYRENEKPYPVRHPAPTLGQYNDEVLTGVLGLSHSKIELLAAEGIIGATAIPPSE